VEVSSDEGQRRSGALWTCTRRRPTAHWTSRARRVLAAAGFSSIDGCVQRVQGSEREVQEMVVHGRSERRGEWLG
jgi:hypothetical protein